MIALLPSYLQHDFWNKYDEIFFHQYIIKVMAYSIKYLF